MEIRTTAGRFNDIFKPVYALSENCITTFQRDSVEIPGVSRSHSSFAIVSVSGEAFEDYRAGGARLGLRLTRLMNILEMAGDSDPVHFRLDEDENMIDFSVENKEFVLGMVDIESIPNIPDLPDHDYPVQFDITKPHFKDAVETAGIIADDVGMVSSPDADFITLSAHGDIDKTTIHLRDGEEINLNRAADCQNRFSLNLLSDIVRVIPTAAEFSIKLGNGIPLVIEYNFANDSGDVTYTIAPYGTR